MILFLIYFAGMAAAEIVLNAVDNFLKEAQRLGAVKDYSLVKLEIDKSQLPEFERIASHFIQIVKNTLTSSAHDASSTLEYLNEINVEDTENNSSMNKELVQIQVDENEINRRISAFISRKRKEVDEWNVQEFCSRPFIEEENPLWEQVDSCARVDAVFVPRFGSRSHIKVSKVENRWGPQTRNEPSKKIKLGPDKNADEQTDTACGSINERLLNMESHLKLKSDSSLRCNVFQRLKALEEKILFLEGISPEYLHSVGTNYVSPKKKSCSEKEKIYSNWGVDDLQKRILTLRDSLKSKSLQIKKETLD